MNDNDNAASVSTKSTVCDLCEGSGIVAFGTQAGSACACDPCWENYRAERAADIRAGLGGFSRGGEAATHVRDW